MQIVFVYESRLQGTKPILYSKLAVTFAINKSDFLLVLNSIFN